MNTVGGASKAGIKLKSSTGWNVDGDVPVVTNEYGFSALPGGLGSSEGRFYDVGDLGYWWSATEDDASNVWGRFMGYSTGSVGRGYISKAFLLSVRCVRD